MLIPSFAYAAGENAHPYRWPFGLSLAGHAILIGLMLYTPNWDRTRTYMPSVIDVQVVDLADLSPAPAASSDQSKKATTVTKPPKEKIETAPVAPVESASKPEVSVAPPRKKTKTALKTKTFKTKKVLKNALQRVEKKVDTLPPKPLEDTIKRLRDKVAKEGKPTPQTVMDEQSSAKGKTGPFVSSGSQKEIELIDLYRTEIAFTINKNWAFAEQLAGSGNNLMASIVFKVMPDGSIVDVFFTDRSGNQYLDDSAQKAIMKSSPVQPHPKQLMTPYVEMGLRFTPEGVR